MALPGLNWLTRQAPSKTPATARPTVASKPVSRAANAGARGSRGVVDAYDGVHPDYDLTVGIFPTPKGAYGFLLHERISGETAIVDPMDAGPIVALARARGCGIHHVLNTHHHNCAGNLALKRRPAARSTDPPPRPTVSRGSTSPTRAARSSAWASSKAKCSPCPDTPSAIWPSGYPAPACCYAATC